MKNDQIIICGTYQKKPFLGLFDENGNMLSKKVFNESGEFRKIIAENDGFVVAGKVYDDSEYSLAYMFLGKYSIEK